MRDHRNGWAWRRLCQRAYEVYGYWCYLCHTPIDPDLPRGHPLSKTVDHIVPVHVAGDVLPTIDEVRPAHRRCNSSRGDRALDRTRATTSRDW